MAEESKVSLDQEAKKERRSSNWTVVVYPESAPDNWQEIIDDQHIEWVCSPLHDQDVNADGEPKKAHYHVLLMFGSLKSYDQVHEFVQPLNCPIPKRCHNVKSLVRYMAHLDNPEKHQYDKSDIVAHGGVDLSDLLMPSMSERQDLIKEMQFYIRDQGIVELQDIMDYAAQFRPDDWYPLLVGVGGCCYIINLYIKSQRHRQRSDQEHDNE